MSLKCFITKNMTKRFPIMKLGMFRLCRFTATGSILSSAQWVCSDDLPWMIINEIGAHYDESMLIINLFFVPAYNDQSRLKCVPLGSSRSCALPLSCFQGQSCSLGARPSIWKNICTQFFAHVGTDYLSACTR